MSSEPIPSRSSGAQTVAGFLAAFSIFVAALAVVYHPVRLTIPAVLLAMIAAGIGGRHARLAYAAALMCVVCWTLGMTVAVVTRHPLW
jgi:hypothetical protein